MHGTKGKMPRETKSRKAVVERKGSEMKYRNASEIFPDELLREIQKYSSGELVYIPEKEEKKGWGAVSGARVYYEQRNEEIRRRFYVEKQKMQELAEEYGLSVETVRKILYR